MCVSGEGGGVQAASARDARASARDAYMEDAEKERQAAAETAMFRRRREAKRAHSQAVRDHWKQRRIDRGDANKVGRPRGDNYRPRRSGRPTGHPPSGKVLTSFYGEGRQRWVTPAEEKVLAAREAADAVIRRERKDDIMYAGWSAIASWLVHTERERLKSARAAVEEAEVQFERAKTRARELASGANTAGTLGADDSESAPVDAEEEAEAAKDSAKSWAAVRATLKHRKANVERDAVVALSRFAALCSQHRALVGGHSAPPDTGRGGVGATLRVVGGALGLDLVYEARADKARAEQEATARAEVEAARARVRAERQASRAAKQSSVARASRARMDRSALTDWLGDRVSLREVGRAMRGVIVASRSGNIPSCIHDYELVALVNHLVCVSMPGKAKRGAVRDALLRDADVRCGWDDECAHSRVHEERWHDGERMRAFDCSACDAPVYRCDLCDRVVCLACNGAC